MMSDDRFVVLVDAERIVIIDKTKVREILDEHSAQFPLIFNVSRGNPVWKEHKLDSGVRGVHFSGGVDKSGRHVPAQIWIKHDAIEQDGFLRRAFVHELRHWWQHANKERYARFRPREGEVSNRTKRRLKLVGVGCVIGALLGVALVGLWEVFVIGLLLACLAQALRLALSPLPREENPAERDAYGYVDERGDDPEWKDAVFVIRKDELARIKHTIDRLNEAMAPQKLKSDP